MRRSWNQNITLAKPLCVVKFLCAEVLPLALQKVQIVDLLQAHL